MMQELEVVDKFAGKFADLSNFAPVTIYYKGMKFPTVEHAFAASKSEDGMFRYDISQLPSRKAGKAKREGRKTRVRKDWEIVKLKNMKGFLNQKFGYDKYRKLLISTDGAIIIEGNYWHDNYWGDCQCAKCKNIMATNHLGIMIMAIRSNL
jgi:ribA/ribD-fused uncharacterized protein